MDKDIAAQWAQAQSPQDLLDRIYHVFAENRMEEMPFVEPALDMLLKIEPGNAGIVYLFGTYHLHCKRFGLAEAVFRRAIEMNPESVESYNNLGVCLHELGRHKESGEMYRKALDIAPEGHPAFTEMYNNYGSTFINNGTPDEALKWFEKSLEVEPGNPDARWNRGLALLEKGEWETGWDDYEAGLQTTHKSSEKRKRRHAETVPYWNGESGQDLLVGVYGEQGVGDEIMAASMLSEAAARAPILYEAHPRLVNIMRFNFTSFPIYGTRKVAWGGEDPLHWTGWTRDLTHKCPILSLGRLFRRSADAFPRTPYLKPFPGLVAKYKQRLAEMGPRPKIGFSWKGGGEKTRKDLRSIPLEMWLPLIREMDADFISLQYDPAPSPGWNTPIVEAFERDTGVKINHWPDVVNDLDECYAGLIHGLDLVISINNSLVHACGAFGVPCWTLTPSRPAWRYGVKGAHMQWYGDHVVQYRQEGDDWQSVLNQIQKDLGRLLSQAA